jgi:hypothetical protein
MPFVRKNSHKILIALGSLIWSLTMVKSGLTYSFGLGFWGANGHDGIWHLAVAGQLAKGSFGMPVFAGELIKNYHLGFDLLLAGLFRLTRIPLSVLYFQILPPLIALAFGISLYLFVKDWKGNKSIALIALFFGYFGGSWGWLVNLFRFGNFGGESMFWSQQSISTLINPPYALSLVFLSLALLSLHRFVVNNRPKYFWLTAVLFGLLPLIKVYAGLLSLCGLFSVAVYDSLKFRRLKMWKLFAVTAAISAAVFFPFNRGAAGLIVFKPFWFLDSMLSVSDRLNWPRLFNALTAYRQTGNVLKLTLGYAVALTVFLVGNLGTRLIGLNMFKSFRRFGPMEYFLSTVFLAGFFVPTAFVQSGTPWNTIQFFYYSLYVMNIFAAVSVFYLLRRLNRRTWQPLLLSALLLLTIPTTLDSLKHYLPSRPPAMVSRQETEALKFLSGQPRGVIFTYPVSPDPYAPAPRPLYLYESTAYVSAFSGHPTYLEDTVNLNITGFNWPLRRDLSYAFIKQASVSAALSFIEQNQIRYIYLPDVSKYRPVLSASQLGGQVIFENSQVSVWAVGASGQP